MAAADELTALVNDVLAQLPRGSNPWAAIRAALRAQVRPKLGDDFLAQLYTTSAIIALSTVLFIASLWIKWREGTYWLFRTHKGSGGRFIVPHYSSCWITGFVIFFGVLQGYLWKSVDFSSGRLVPDSALWRTLVWYAGWLAYYLAAWSLCVSRRPSKSIVAQAPFLNTAAILVISGSALSISILGGCSHVKYRNAMSHYTAIDKALAALQTSYGITGRFDISEFLSGPGLPVAESFVNELASFGTYFRWTFIAYLTWTLLLEILLVGAGVLHLRELRRTLDEVTGGARPSPEARKQEKMLEQTYNSLVYVTYAVCILLTLFNAIFAFVAAAGSKVVYIRSYAEAAGLLPPWIFASLGLPLSVLFFRRTYLARKTKNAQAPALLTNAASEIPRPLLAKAAPTTESVPLTTLTYAREALASSPSSPNSTQMSYQKDDGVSPGLPGNSPHLSSATGKEREELEQPFYSSYASREPAEVEEVKASTRLNWR